MKKLAASIVLWLTFLAIPAFAQAPPTVKLCIPTTGTTCVPITASAPMPITGSFTATLSGFTPNGNYGSLTATAASSASTAMPAGTVVSFQNLSLIDVSCVLSSGAATATTNKLIVRAGATVYYTVGTNVNAACINQTGSASNVVAMAGGAGLGTNFGGGSGGGGGGAVTMASGAVVSGAYASGSLASGAVVDLTNLSGTTAAAVPAKAIYPGLNISGNIVGLTGLATGATVKAATVAIVDASGNQITTFGGSGGTASSFAAAFPATGTAIGMSQGGNMVALTGTSGNLNVTGTVAATQSGAWQITNSANTAQAQVVANSDALANQIGLSVNGQLQVYNGTTWDRLRGDTTSGAWVNVKSSVALSVNPGTAANWGVGTSTQNSASIANGVLQLAQFNTTPTTVTSGNMSPLQMDSAGNLLVNIKAGAAAGGTSSSFGSAFPASGTAIGFTDGTNMIAGRIKAASTASVAADPSIVTNESPNSQLSVATGTTADSAWVSGSGTTISLLKNIAGGVAGSIPTGSAVIGKTGIDQTTDGTTNLAAMGAQAGASGATTRLISCDSTAVYDASTTGSTQLVALSSGKTVYVCGYSIMGGGTVNVKLIYGTGAACATGSVNMTPAYQLTAQAGIVDKSPFYSGLKTAASNALCINASGAVAAQAIVYYAQF